MRFLACFFLSLAVASRLAADEKYTTDASVIREAIVGQWNWIVNGKDKEGWVVFEANGKFVYEGERYTWKVSASGIITVMRTNRQEASLHLSADKERITGTDFSHKAVQATRRKQ